MKQQTGKEREDEDGNREDKTDEGERKRRRIWRSQRGRKSGEMGRYKYTNRQLRAFEKNYCALPRV